MKSTDGAAWWAGVAAVPDVLRRVVGSRRPGTDDELGGAALTAEIDALFARTSQDFDGALTALVSARLRPVVLRRVPVSAVRPSPAPHTARVLFADGTVVLARGERPGDLGQLAMTVLLRTPVCLAACRCAGDVAQLDFAVRSRHLLTARAVGLDQAD